MTADERLALIEIKINRAKEHLSNLERAIRAFFDSKPYEVSTKRDPTRRLIYYISRVQPTPMSFATITGDAIQNLRSALDQLAYQLFLVGTGGTTDGRHIYFPIDHDIAEYRRNLSRRTNGMRQDAIDTLNVIEPYKGGKGHDLWVLHELNNIDKHRLLITVGSAYQSFNVGEHMRPMLEKQTLAIGLPPPPRMDVYLRPADNLCPLKVGDELFIDGVDAEVNPKLDFRFNISLKEPGIAEGPLVDMLENFLDVVNKTLLAFKPCLS